MRFRVIGAPKSKLQILVIVVLAIILPPLPGSLAVEQFDSISSLKLINRAFKVNKLSYDTLSNLDPETLELLIDFDFDATLVAASPVATRLLQQNRQALELMREASKMMVTPFSKEKSINELENEAVSLLEYLLWIEAQVHVGNFRYDLALDTCFQAIHLTEHFRFSRNLVGYLRAGLISEKYKKLSLKIISKCNPKSIENFHAGLVKFDYYKDQDFHLLLNADVNSFREQMLEELNLIDLFQFSDDQIDLGEGEANLRLRLQKATKKATRKLLNAALDDYQSKMVKGNSFLFGDKPSRSSISLKMVLSRSGKYLKEVKSQSVLLNAKAKAIVLSNENRSIDENKKLASAIARAGGSLLTGLSWSGYTGALKKRARFQLLHRVVLMSCRLELLHSKKGSYPETVLELGPAHLYKDPFDGSVLRYQVELGGYKIWSVGPNLKNDMGVACKENRGMAGENCDIVFEKQ